MGGFGSTRWASYTKKTVVEECLVLDLHALGRLVSLLPGTRGQLYWYAPSGILRGALAFVVEQQAPLTFSLRVSYLACQGDGQQPVEDAIPLAFRGSRWWLTCPLVRAEHPCGRRVSKLYLPPHAQHFACRVCHHLSYRSSQHCHIYDAGARRLARDLLGMTAEGILDLLRQP